MTKRALAMGLLLAACGDDGNEATAATAATVAESGSADDTSGCTRGTEGCPCIEGALCVGDLICLSNVCVDDGNTGSADEGDTDKPATETGAGADESGGDVEGSCVGNCLGSSPHHGGLCFCDPTCASNDSCCPDYADACPGQCLYNEDCASDEVCNSAQECVLAWGQTYDVCVDYWRDYSPTCWDFDECYADAFYQILYGGDPVFTSVTHGDVVSTSWDDCFAMEINSDIDDGTQSSQVWAIRFLDDDVDADDPINSVCAVAEGSCSYLPLSYLHDGVVVWSNTPEYPYEVWVRFVAL